MSEKHVPLTTPVELLLCRRWERALFTTYSLSLTFFETIVLRALRQQGCQDVWLLADAEGYRASLMERRSMRVGQEYRLVPVALPRGVFHPKCSYLAGPDGDLLFVGSGNLTFGGFGRNIEVMEVFESKFSPEVFWDFGQFLESLSRRQDVRIPDLNWLPWFRDRAAAVTRSVEPSQRPRLIHSVDRPILDQLSEMVPAPVTRLTVLSPFHDLRGTAVENLAEGLSCKRLRVGLPSNRNEQSTFPFKVSSRWRTPPTAVRLIHSASNRRLHAKWIEAESGGQRFVLTGSVNATTKALCTVDNIEVGIFRVFPEHTASPWQKAEIPKVTKVLEYEVSGLGDKSIVYASLAGDGALHGHIISNRETAGTWSGRLRAANQRTAEFVAAVNPRGHFHCRPSGIDQVLLTSGLQIEMERNGLSARGWVHQSDLLRIGGLRHLGISGLLRIINGDETEDDDIALLEYFAISAASHSLTFTRPIQARSLDPTARDRIEADIELAEIAPGDAIKATNELSRTNHVDGADALARVFSQLRKRLLGRRPPSGAAPPTAAVDEDDPEEPQDNTHSRVSDAFHEFQGQMEQLTSDPKLDPVSARGLYVIWFEVALHMYLGRLGDPSDAFAFLKYWFRAVTERAPAPGEVTALEQYLYTTAGVLVLLSPTENDLLLSQLHENLEKFNRGDDDHQYAIDCAKDGSEAGTIHLLLGDRHASLLPALQRVLDAPTVRQELLAVLKAYDSGLPIRTDTPVFHGSVGEEFRTALQTRPTRPIYLPQYDERTACAHCFHAFTPAWEMNLRHRRFARCDVRCRKWTVRLNP